jgi:hypothetical protein
MNGGLRLTLAVPLAVPKRLLLPEPARASAQKRDPAHVRHRRLKLFKKTIFDRVSIGAEKEPTQLVISNKLEAAISNIMGTVPAQIHNHTKAEVHKDSNLTTEDISFD